MVWTSKRRLAYVLHSYKKATTKKPHTDARVLSWRIKSHGGDSEEVELEDILENTYVAFIARSMFGVNNIFQMTDSAIYLNAF